MKMKNILLALITIILTLTACNSSNDVEKTDSNSNADSNSIEEKLVFAANTDVETLDPHAANDKTSSQVIDMIYNRLIKYDEDNNIVGDMALDWEVSDYGTTWTFELKEGIKFQD